MGKLLGVLGVGFGLVAMGCAFEPLSGDSTAEMGSDSESVERTSEALVGGWVLGPYRQRQGEQTLQPVATHVCLLAGVRGLMTEPLAEARVLESEGQWILRAAGTVEAIAYCFPRSGFRDNNNARPSGTHLTPEVSARNGRSVGTSGGQAFTFLTGIQGQMVGRDARAIAEPGGPPPTLGAIRAYPHGGVLSAFGRAFSVGSSVTRPATWVAEGGHHTETSFSYRLPMPAHSSRAVPMAPTGAAMCGLTLVHGMMMRSGWGVEIRPVVINGTQTWALTADSQSLLAEARCFARNQSMNAAK